MARAVATFGFALGATAFAQAACADDVAARVIADKLGQVWGKQVVVLNGPGADGGVAARHAAAAPPDGYTLFIPSTNTRQAGGAPATDLPKSPLTAAISRLQLVENTPFARDARSSTDAP